MNRLPIETLDEIVEYLLCAMRKERMAAISPLELSSTLNMTSLTWGQKPILAPYSTINRKWQGGINTNTLPKLQCILSGATGDRRIRSIRCLQFSIVRSQKPPLTQHIEPEKEQRLANESFSENMRILFGLLKGWEERLDESGSLKGDFYELHLFLATDCQQSAVNPPLLLQLPSTYKIINEWAEPLLQLPRIIEPVNGWTKSVTRVPPRIDVQYVGKEKLPDLCLVSSVELYENHGIHPETVMRILSRMKHLVKFKGNIFQEGGNLSLTRGYREVLAQCLHLLPRSVNVFCPEFKTDPSPQTSSSVLVDPRRDHLCIGIRARSGQLRKLKLKGLRISPAIFAGDYDGSYPDWSRLKEIDIRYPGLSSTGQWFLEEDPDFSLPFTVLNLKLLNELYAEAGKAKQHMPSLKSLDLKLRIKGDKHKLKYYFETERNRSSIVVHSSIAFNFSNRVAKAWGFSRDAVESYEEADTIITKVIF